VKYDSPAEQSVSFRKSNKAVSLGRSILSSIQSAPSAPRSRAAQQSTSPRSAPPPGAVLASAGLVMPKNAPARTTQPLASQLEKVEMRKQNVVEQKAQTKDQPQVSPPVSLPSAQLDQGKQPAPSKESQDASGGQADQADAGAITDYTKIPSEMEKKFEELDEDSALRPTIINPGNTWTKRYQKALLAEPETMTMLTEEQGKERNKAFDLLDALTKSGGLSVDHASLHVVVAATHCFDKTLTQTVIEDNVNPIEKVERSSLIVASTIHQTSPANLISDAHLERVGTYSPMLLGSSKDLEPALSRGSDPNRN